MTRVHVEYSILYAAQESQCETPISPLPTTCLHAFMIIHSLSHKKYVRTWPYIRKGSCMIELIYYSTVHKGAPGFSLSFKSACVSCLRELASL